MSVPWSGDTFRMCGRHEVEFAKEDQCDMCRISELVEAAWSMIIRCNVFEHYHLPSSCSYCDDIGRLENALKPFKGMEK